MITGIFDSHAHYDDEAFDKDRAALLTLLRGRGVCGIINAASNLESARHGIALARQFPFIRAAAGIHPLDADTVTPDSMNELRQLLQEPEVVALGEIGLDFHYDVPRELQFPLLRDQLALAREMDMPVILHDRDAHGPMLELLKEFRPRGVVHCFSGSAEMAQEVVKLGLYVGLGGAATFKNAVHPLKVAAVVPDDRLLLETDAPYMTPVPFRGKRNDSAMIAYTAERIAQVRGTTAQSLCDLTRRNACTLFGLNEKDFI
jgi:TatD DNase family protein